MHPGLEDWDDQIDEALRTCRAVLFVMTADSVTPTSVCKNEWARALAYKKPVVPLRFGTTLADRDAVVEELLAPAYDQLVGLLRRFDGLAEVTVRAFYREEEVLREIVREHPRLARLRDTASPLELGEAVAKALAAKRDAAAAEIVDTVGRFALDVALDERRTELEIVRGAFLIDRDALASVDRELAELARAQAETTVFKYTGPLPPHHFVSFAAG